MKIIIIGAGKVGKKIADQLTSEEHDIIVIDNDLDTINTLYNNQDLMCIQGNGALLEVQQEAGVKNADIVIAATQTDEVNMLCCLLAKKLGAKHCIARVRTPGYYKQLDYMKNELGINMTVNPEYETATEITRILLLPDAAQVEVFENGKVEVIEFKMPETSPFAGISLAESYNKFKSKTLICAAERNGEIIIPDGSFVPLAGDRLSVVCTQKDAEEFFKKSGSRKEKIKSIIIVGGGVIGYYLASQLSNIGMSIKIIEKDYKRCLELTELLSDVTIVNGDGTDHHTLKEEGIESVDAFVALTGMDEENVIMSMYAQTKNVSKIVTKVTRGSYISLSNHIGLDSVISPKLLAANNILGYVRARKNSENSNNIETIYKIVNEKVEALEFIVREDDFYTGKPLRELSTKKDVLIASIIRGSKTIIPDGADIIQKDDRVIVITTEKKLHEFREIFI